MGITARFQLPGTFGEKYDFYFLEDQPIPRIGEQVDYCGKSYLVSNVRYAQYKFWDAYIALVEVSVAAAVGVKPFANAVIRGGSTSQTSRERADALQTVMEYERSVLESNKQLQLSAIAALK